MPEYHLFAFGGYNGVTERLQGQIEVWDLNKISFDDFVCRIREKMPNDKNVDYTECLWHKMTTSELYEKCRWGLLLPWGNGDPSEFAVVNLLSLYSPVFLYPRFHVNKHGAFAPYTQNEFEDNQNQSQEFAKNEFVTFFEKMCNTTPLLYRDLSKTCDWEYDDCCLYMAHNIFEDLKAYLTKNPEKAGKEYIDITMILELLLTTKDEREKPQAKKNNTIFERLRGLWKRIFSPEEDGKITSRIRNRAAIILSLSGKRKEEIYDCIDRRGSYVHGRFVQDVLDILRAECRALSDRTQHYTPPLDDLFDFSKKLTRHARFILVALLYIHVHAQYTEWCKQHGGLAKIADAAISNDELKNTLQERVKEILQLLPDYQ